MPLQPLEIVKNWFTNTRTREENWDVLRKNISAFATRTNNNLKQLGLDIGGSSYDFNNVGKSTEPISILARLDTLENQATFFSGAKNLGFDLSDPAKIKLVSANGTALSATNIGQVSFNSTTNAGQIITRNITTNLEVSLIGAHWGFDTGGDLTDYPLWVVLLDTGSSVILGVLAQAGRTFINSADTSTTPGSINSIEKVLVSSAPAGNYNATYMAWVKANFDDTGNALGENYWEVQDDIGDININEAPQLIYAEVIF